MMDKELIYSLFIFDEGIELLIGKATTNKDDRTGAIEYEVDEDDVLFSHNWHGEKILGSYFLGPMEAIPVGTVNKMVKDIVKAIF
jgi:hypothetical protein